MCSMGKGVLAPRNARGSRITIRGIAAVRVTPTHTCPADIPYMKRESRVAVECQPSWTSRKKRFRLKRGVVAVGTWERRKRNWNGLNNSQGQRPPTWKPRRGDRLAEGFAVQE